jgi:hypothetical protein
MLVFVTTKPKCSHKNKTHRTEHGTNSTRTSTKEKTKKKTREEGKKQSNKLQKNTAKAEKRNSFTKRSTALNKVQEKKQGENKEKTKNVEIQIRTKCMSEKDTSI